MPDQNIDYFHVASSIMKQREQDSLIEIIAEILSNAISGSTVTLINPADVLANPTGTPDILLRKSLDERKNILDIDKCRYIYPVLSVGKVKKIIDINSPSLPDQLDALEKIFALFNYQQVLLDNNHHDALTGLLNRHSFESRMNKITDSRLRRDSDNQSSCFALFDIDFFKSVNDNYGHLYGDEVLILLAHQMEDTFRYNDMLFRYGGEEFAAILSDVNLEQATPVLNRFRENIEQFDFPQVGQVTISIGVTEISMNVNRLELITRADRALYYSKENGRNQVNCFETLLEQGLISETTPEEQEIELF